MSTDAKELQDRLADAAQRHGVPGVAVGVHQGGRQHYAYHGVTSVENPLAVDPSTLFQLGSVTKTYTATVLAILADEGRIALDAPVREYVPELKLAEEEVARTVTVLQLLNHTAGWDGDFPNDTGAGDDAIARYVAAMDSLTQVTRPGTIAVYNNAALTLAGRVIECVTRSTYEAAVRDLLLAPLGLTESSFFATDIMTRRFTNGYVKQDDGSLEVVRPWGMPRSLAPSGGLSATAVDALAFARFNLGTGAPSDGKPPLSADTLARMHSPTVDAYGALGDNVGIGWLLTDADGVRISHHAGATPGQHALLVVVRERDFAFVCLTNSGPNGIELYKELRAWALDAYAGVVEPEPEPVECEPAQLEQYVGTYQAMMGTFEVSVENGGLRVAMELNPAIREQLLAEGAPDAFDVPPAHLGMLGGAGDRHVVVGGWDDGTRGYFTRDASGAVDGIHYGGRYAPRA
jgi:CubicO group peptidase (beta-lactamase class C family)